MIQESENLYTIKQYIRLRDCKHGWLYRIASRNLRLGVFRKDRKGFVGIREKFGQEFLFVEYHWDADRHLGTVKPEKQLEKCPIEDLDEYLKNKSGTLGDNKPLFDWLIQKELEHIGPRPKKSKPPSAIVIFGGR
jgi:hypothetical protein